MSIGTVVTRGYSVGNASFVVTRGYGNLTGIDAESRVARSIDIVMKVKTIAAQEEGKDIGIVEASKYVGVESG